MDTNSKIDLYTAILRDMAEEVKGMRGSIDPSVWARFKSAARLTYLTKPPKAAFLPNHLGVFAE